ncbi:MAG: PQQ-binding-like beta-propeller repeat protein [Candidatus Acidifodinimicrobium sp.]
MKRYLPIFIAISLLALILSSCMNLNEPQNEIKNNQQLYYVFKNAPVKSSPPTFTNLWSYQTGNWVVSSPALSPDGKTLYVGSVDHYFYAINAQNGNVLWKVLLAGPVISSPSISINGNIYVVASTLSSVSYSATGTGYLYKISPGGNVITLYTFPNIVGTSPLVDPKTGNIYIGCLDGNLYSVSNTGNLNWTFQSGGEIGSSPVLSNDGNTVYFGSANGYFYAVNASNGSVKWKFQTGAGIVSSPALDSKGNVYFGSTDDYVYALNSSGGLIWKYNTGSRIGSSPAISNGVLYIGNEAGYLDAINISNGTLVWQYLTGGYILSSPAVDANGTIYVGSADGNLYAIGSNGSLVWKYPTSDVVGTSPVIAPGGIVYFGSNSDSVYALSTGNGAGLGAGPWPMFRRDIVHSAVGSVDGFKLLGDFQGTGNINFSDLMDIALAWGAQVGQPNYNINYDIGPAADTQGYGYYDTAYPDGVINFTDLMVFAMNWGKQAVNPPDVTSVLSADLVPANITEESSGNYILLTVNLDNVMGCDLVVKENDASFVQKSGLDSDIVLVKEGGGIFHTMIAGTGSRINGKITFEFIKESSTSTLDILKEELR